MAGGAERGDVEGLAHLPASTPDASGAGSMYRSLGHLVRGRLGPQRDGCIDLVNSCSCYMEEGSGWHHGGRGHRAMDGEAQERGGGDLVGCSAIRPGNAGEWR